MREVIVGTRKSKLALIQTNWVIEQLKKHNPKVRFQLKEIDTKGDQNLNVSLTKLGGQGVFLQELEEQLIESDIDMAVHSLKDIPIHLPEKLMIGCIPKREDHRDAYLGRNHILFHDLPKGAVIGTSSIRRAAQILALRPDLTTKWIRGPIDSRIKQLNEGEFDAIILAVAGLKRLGIHEEVITEYLPEEHFIPAPGQGALAIECRADDEELKGYLVNIQDDDSYKSIMTERLFFAAFNEGESAPIGGCAIVSDGLICLRGMVISLDGQTIIRYEASGKDPEMLAQKVAQNLIENGAMDLIEQVNEALAHDTNTW